MFSRRALGLESGFLVGAFVNGMRYFVGSVRLAAFVRSGPRILSCNREGRLYVLFRVAVSSWMFCRARRDRATCSVLERTWAA